MGAIRLGKNHLRWCRTCNLPILESMRCDTCGTDTVEIVLTPPADSRPAFEYDVNLVRRLTDSQFGEGTGLKLLPDGHVSIMNKAPALDRMDEIVADGAILGAIRFDIGIGWKLIVRMQGAMRIGGFASKGYVTCHPEAIPFVKDSKNLMVPGVLDVHPEVKEGDEVLILSTDKEVIATGIARMSAEDMKSSEKGVAVKTRWYKPEELVSSDIRHTWDEVVQANETVIRKRVDEAVNFIHSTIAKNDLPAVVSLSGGKDSLASLLLTMDAGLKLPVLFINTGLEFNETVDHVHDIVKRHDIKLYEETAPADAFFGNLEYFGPPAKDFRWCCKTNKLGPTVAAIGKHFPGGVLSFIGQRKYESEARNAKPRVWTNPWTPGQLGASPIQNWCAMHIWLYIFYKEEPFNVWYTRGLDRIGCFLCPASDMSEMIMVSRESDRSPQWNSYLEKYMESNDLPKEWNEFGLWRWKKVPISIKEEVFKVTGKDASQFVSKRTGGDKDPISIKVQEGYSPCVIGYSIEAALSRSIDLRKLKPFTHAITWVPELDEENNILNAGYVTFYGDGSIISKANVEMDARAQMDQSFQLVVRSEQCVGCGLCASRCKPGALYMKDGRIQIKENDCIFCKDCFGYCPAVKFGADITNSIEL